MTTAPDYLLARDPEEYERLRAQARVFEPQTAQLLDQVALAPGARCLDAGCGPGETMRLLADRVGPDGRVTGLDVDEPLGTHAVATLHAEGRRQCMFLPFDVTAGEPIPGGPYDVVLARLLLIHVEDPVDVLRRLWEAVAPGGHLILQEYDARTARLEPELASVDEWHRTAVETFRVGGCDLNLGLRLPALLDEAGIGMPDGMDAAARLAPLPELAPMYEAVYRSLLPAALQLGVTTEDRAQAWFDAFARESAGASTCAALWALMIGAWKRKR